MIRKLRTRTETFTITLKHVPSNEWFIGFIKGPYLYEKDLGLRSINSSRRNAIADLLVKASQRIYED